MIDKILNRIAPALPLPSGFGGHPPKPPSGLAPHICHGNARVLQGNPDTVGRRSGFDTQPSTEPPKITVPPNSVAVIPRQWGGAGPLRPVLGSVFGTAGSGSSSESFNGIGDTIGSTDVANVQGVLMSKNPGVLILEFVNGAKDLNTVPVTIVVPASIPCPCGTTDSGPLW